MNDFNEKYNNQYIRVLEWFTKKRGKMVGNEELKGLSIIDLRALYKKEDPFMLPKGVTFDEAYDQGYDPYMVECYDVTEEKVIFLQKFVQHKICIKKYDYVVSTYDVPSLKERLKLVDVVTRKNK